MTSFQKTVLAQIRKHAGDDSRFLAMELEVSYSAFQRAARALERQGLVCSEKVEGRKDWWPVIFDNPG